MPLVSETGGDPGYLCVLSGLADNGGDTQTHALISPYSPAIDAIPVASCPLSTDQRDVTRPLGERLRHRRLRNLELPTCALMGRRQ